jgi:hypothetical protein
MKRANLGGRQITPDEIQHVQDVHDDYVKWQLADQEHQNELTNQDGQIAGQQAAQRIIRQPPPRNQGDSQLDIETLKTKISNKVENGDLDISPQVQLLARYFVQSGIREVDPLIDAVHGVLKEIVPDIDRSDAMNAISGYGRFKPLSKDDVSVTLRDLKGQMQQRGKLESMAGGEAPLKTGMERRAPSDAERALMKQVNEAKKRGGYAVTDPEAQLRTAQQARTTRLTNQISDLERQIAARQRDVPTNTKLPVDPGTQTLIDRRNALQKELDVVVPRPEATPEQKLAARMAIMQRTLAYWQQKLVSGDFTPRTKPVATFTDPKAIDIQNQINAVKDRWKSEAIKDQLAHRTDLEKGMDYGVNWARMVKLSSVTVMPKLILAGLGEVVMNPFLRPLGQPLRMIPGFAEKAGGYEMGWSVRAEAANMVGMIMSIPSSMEKLTTGKSNIDVVLGRLARDPDFTNYVGWVHGALKEPVRQGAFARSLYYRNIDATRRGLNPHDPVVQTSIVTAAAQDADREIFSNKNLLTMSFRVGMRYLSTQGNTGLVMSKIGQLIFPIVNIPTNLAIYQARLLPPIGLGEALVRLVAAAKQGKLQDDCAGLDPEDARKISVAWKLGLGGIVLGAYAWTHSQYFGGAYGEGPQHENTLKPNQIRVGGFIVPAWLSAFPVLGYLNSIASCSRIFRKSYRTGEGTLNATAEASAFALMCPVRQLPYVDEFLRLLGSNKTPGQIAGQFTRDAIIPSASTRTMDLMDATQRNPKTFTQEWKMGIPGLHQTVPFRRQSPMPLPSVSLPPMSH